MLKLLISFALAYLVYLILGAFSYLEDVHGGVFAVLGLIIYLSFDFLAHVGYFLDQLPKGPTRKFVPIKTEIKKKDSQINIIED